MTPARWAGEVCAENRHDGGEGFGSWGLFIALDAPEDGEREARRSCCAPERPAFGLSSESECLPKGQLPSPHCSSICLAQRLASGSLVRRRRTVTRLQASAGNETNGSGRTLSHALRAGAHSSPISSIARSLATSARIWSGLMAPLCHFLAQPARMRLHLALRASRNTRRGPVAAPSARRPSCGRCWARTGGV